MPSIQLPGRGEKIDIINWNTAAKDKERQNTMAEIENMARLVKLVDRVGQKVDRLQQVVRSPGRPGRDNRGMVMASAITASPGQTCLGDDLYLRRDLRQPLGGRT